MRFEAWQRLHERRHVLHYHVLEIAELLLAVLRGGGWGLGFGVWGLGFGVWGLVPGFNATSTVLPPAL